MSIFTSYVVNGCGRFRFHIYIWRIKVPHSDVCVLGCLHKCRHNVIVLLRLLVSSLRVCLHSFLCLLRVDLLLVSTSETNVFGGGIGI